MRKSSVKVAIKSGKLIPIKVVDSPLDPISALFLKIPKEYHKDVRKLNKIFHELGAKEVLRIVSELTEIDAKEVGSYVVVHDSCIDGG